MPRTIVTSYIDPDLDGIACLIGYSEFLAATGTSAQAVITGTPHAEALYLLREYNILQPPLYSDWSSADHIILVDVSMLSDIDPRIIPEQVTEIIDHRSLTDTKPFLNAKVDIELVGAAATLIAERFIHNATKPSHNAAVLLYGAIVSHTLNLRNRITTERDRSCANWLSQQLSLPTNFIHNLFSAKSDTAGTKLGMLIEHDYAWRVHGDINIGIAQLELINAAQLIQARQPEILAALESTKIKQGCDHTFLTAIDLDELANYFVTDDKFLQKHIAKIFNTEFIDNVAKVPGPYMRKEIQPMLQKYFTTLH